MDKIQDYGQHQTPVRMWSNGNSYSLLAGVQNDAATMEENVVVSLQN